MNKFLKFTLIGSVVLAGVLVILNFYLSRESLVAGPEYVVDGQKWDSYNIEWQNEKKPFVLIASFQNQDASAVTEINSNNARALCSAMMSDPPTREGAKFLPAEVSHFVTNFRLDGKKVLPFDLYHIVEAGVCSEGHGFHFGDANLEYVGNYHVDEKIVAAWKMAGTQYEGIEFSTGTDSKSLKTEFSIIGSLDRDPNQFDLDAACIVALSAIQVKSNVLGMEFDASSYPKIEVKISKRSGTSLANYSSYAHGTFAIVDGKCVASEPGA